MMVFPGHGAPLVPASFFGIVLGVIGLGNPWRLATRVWELPTLPGEMIMLAGVLVWAVLVVLYASKWVFAREVALAEARHPIQCCFIGLAGVATMMVAMASFPYSRAVAQLLFFLGLIFTLGFAVWRTGGLWMGERAVESSTPVLYLPTVAGGFVAANAAGLLGYGALAQLSFGAAFFSWLAIESVLVHRLLTGRALDPALRPTLGIQLAPPTVGGVAAISALDGTISVLPMAMLGYGLLQAMVLIRLMGWIRQQAFTPGYWGFAFGVTALSMLSLRLTETGQLSDLPMLAPTLFVTANVVIAALACASLRQLLTREPRPVVPDGPRAST